MNELNHRLLVAAACFAVLGVSAAATTGGAEPGKASGYDYLVTHWGEKNTTLVGEDGAVKKTWKGWVPGVSARLCEDGSVIRIGQTSVGKAFLKGGPAGGVLERVDAAGRHAWTYLFAGETAMIHGDAVSLPGGNVLVLIASHVSAANALKQGRDPSRATEAGLWVDGITEIEPGTKNDGKTIWKWSAWDSIGGVLPGKEKPLASGGSEKPAIDVNRPHGTGPAWSRVTGLDYDKKSGLILMVASGSRECWVVRRPAPGGKEAPALVAVWRPEGVAAEPGVQAGGAVELCDARWVPDAAGQEPIFLALERQAGADAKPRQVRLWRAALVTRAQGEGKQAELAVTAGAGRWVNAGAPVARIRPMPGGQWLLFDPKTDAAVLGRDLAQQEPVPIRLPFSSGTVQQNPSSHRRAWRMIELNSNKP